MSDNRTAEQMKAAKIYAASILGYKWKNVRDDDTIVAGYLQGHKDASQQTASLKEENERLQQRLSEVIRESSNRSIIIAKHEQLQEEVERLRGEQDTFAMKFLEYASGLAVSNYKSGGSWYLSDGRIVKTSQILDQFKALSGKESKPS